MILEQLNNDISEINSNIKLLDLFTEDDGYTIFETLIEKGTTIDELKNVSKHLTEIYHIYNFEFIISNDISLLRIEEIEM
jgi:hypothetical protein